MRLRLLMEDLHEVCHRDEPLQRLNVPRAELVVDHKPDQGSSTLPNSHLPWESKLKAMAASMAYLFLDLKVYN